MHIQTWVGLGPDKMQIIIHTSTHVYRNGGLQDLLPETIELHICTEVFPSFLGVINVCSVGATQDTPKLINCLQDKIGYTAAAFTAFTKLVNLEQWWCTGTELG